jgi:zinc protease
MNNSRLKHAAAASLLLCGMSFTATGSAWAGAPRALPAGVVKGPSVEGITNTVAERPESAAVPGCVQAYRHRQRHLSGRLAPRELWRDRHGAPAGTHGVQGLAEKQSHSQEFSARGMEFNGTTSNDRTNYYEVFQASPDNLKWALEMEADRMVNSFIARKDLDSEMTVVRNEYERARTTRSACC